MDTLPPVKNTSTKPPPPAPWHARPAAGFAVAIALLFLIAWMFSRPSLRPASVLPPVPPADAALPQVARGRPVGARQLTGRVLDERGEPVARALVRVVSLEADEAPPWDTVVDNEGQFVFAGLPEQALAIDVSAEGHETLERTLPASELAPLVLTIARQGELSLSVRGCGVEPAATAKAYVTGAGLYPAREQLLGATRDALFAGLSGGRYHVQVRCGDHSARTAEAIEVVPGSRARAELTAARAPSLTLHVVDAQSSAPLAGAELALTELTPGMPALSATTDAAGNAHVVGLWAGKLELSVSRAGYVTTRRELDLAEDGVLETELALDGAASVRGRVIDERGMPVAGAILSIAAPDGQPVELGPLSREPQSVNTGELGVTVGPVPEIPVVPGVHALSGTADADGAFAIDGLLPASVQVRASHAGYAAASQLLPELNAHRTQELTLVLRAAGSLRGRVHDAEGRGVAGVYLAARGSDGVELSALSDERGVFRFDDLLGAFVLQPEAPGVQPARCEVTIASRDEAECDFLAAPAGGERRVRIVDELGFAVGGALVSVIGAQGRELASALSARDGSATVHGVPEGGVYKLRASARGYAYAESDGTSELEPLRIVLIKAGAVSGIVLDMTGRGVPNAQVVAEPSEASTLSAGDGSFTLSGLGAGVVVLRAEHGTAGAGATPTLRVRAGETLPGARIVLSGRYLASAGEPAARAEALPAAELSLGIRGADVLVTGVRGGSAAAKAGLRVGDVLASVDGERVLSAAHGRGLLRDPAGKTATLRVVRGGRQVSLRITRSGRAH